MNIEKARKAMYASDLDSMVQDWTLAQLEAQAQTIARLRDGMNSLIVSYVHHCPEADAQSNAVKNARAILAETEIQGE